MNLIFFRYCKVLFVLICLGFQLNSFGQRIASVSGPWSSTTTWGGAAVPIAGQTVVINDNITVTVDVAAVCASLTINAGNNASTVTIAGSNSLTISGALTINSGTGNGDNKIVAVGAGTLSCASISMAITGNNNRYNRLTISTGTATVTGNITMNDNNVNRNQVQITGAGRLNVGGSYTGGDMINATGSIVDYNGAAQTVRTEGYANLILSGSGIKSIGANCPATENLTIASGVTFQPTAGMTFTLGGNLTNAGSLNSDNGANQMDFTFNGTVNQTVSGAGALTEFNKITINNLGATNNNIVEFLPTLMTIIPVGFLTLTRGVIKMSGTYTLANTFITAVNYPVTGFNTVFINANCGIWLNNPNVSVTAQNSDTRLVGLLRITDGTYNAGTLADWWLYYSNGAILTIEGGALNISGSFDADVDAATDNITYTQSGGIFTTNTSGNSGTFGNVSSFGIRAAGSTFTMSGGSIVLQNVRGTVNTANDFQNVAATSTITGGTIQVGNAFTTAPAINFRVNCTPSIYNLLVNNINSPIAEIRANTKVLNDLTISTGGTLDVTTNNYNLSIGHDFINNGTFTQRLGTVTFSGNALQAISGTTSTTFYNLTANNTFGPTTAGISLQKPTTVTNTLTLTSGHITTDATNLLTMNAGSNVAGANYVLRRPKFPIDDNSFVNGPMKKLGNTDFLFPVGEKNAGMHYCGISAPASAADSYTAEYKRASATALGAVTAVGLDHVSNCEYWDISTTVVSPNTNVTLSWNGNSNCNAAIYVNDLATLKGAHFNGTKWNTSGGAFDAGSLVSDGSLTWTGVNTFTTFPFSLGSTSGGKNPLPVKLINVKAYRNGDKNKIEWTNVTESDVAAYEVQKSVNGTNFDMITSLSARSNASDKQDYAAYDYQVDPVAYYRIKVLSADGSTTYSAIVKVAADVKVNTELVLYPNPVTGKQFTIQLNSAPTDYSLRVYAANGQLVTTENFKHPGGNFSKTVELPAQLPAGQYYLQLSGGEQVLSTKFVLQ